MPIDEATKLTLEAILETGSPKYNNHAGATLARLSALARQGQLRHMSQAYWLHALIHPRDRKTLDRLLPWKVLWDFLGGFRVLPGDRVQGWILRNPDWADQLLQAAPNPRRFALMAEIIAAQVADGDEK